MGICLSFIRKNKSRRYKQKEPQISKHNPKIYKKEKSIQNKISIIPSKQKMKILKKKKAENKKLNLSQEFQRVELKLENKTTLKQKVKDDKCGHQAAQKILFTSKLSSTIDNSKFGFKSSLVMQKNSVKKLIEDKGGNIRKEVDDSERLALNLPNQDEVKQLEERCLKNVIEVQEKLALNIGFENLDSIKSGMFTGVLSINTEHMESVDHVEKKIQGYNSKSRVKSFVRKNCFLPRKMMGLVEGKSNRTLKRTLSLKESTGKKPQEGFVVEESGAQSEDVRFYNESRFNSKKDDPKRRVSLNRSRKRGDDKISLQKFVLKKNQLKFINKKSKVEVMRDIESEIMKKKRKKNRRNLSEDNFSSSSSDSDNSEEETNKVQEIKIDFESFSKQEKGSSYFRSITNNSVGRLRNTIEANNCTIERMIMDARERSAKYSQFSDQVDDSPSEFSLNSDKESNVERLVNPSMKLFRGVDNAEGGQEVLAVENVAHLFESQDLDDEELSFKFN